MLDQALRTRRRIRMRYEGMFATDGPSERTVDPLGLVAKGSVWYLVAGVQDQVRTYRASRIQAVEILDEVAARPEDFDLAEFWGRSRQEFERKLPSYLATVRLSPAALGKVKSGWWRYARILEESEPDPRGWTTCTLRTDGLEVARDVVLGLGSGSEVAEPAELKAAVLAAARAALHGVQGNDL